MRTQMKDVPFLLGLFFVLSASSSAAQSGESCLLDDGKYGKCLTVTLCDRMHQEKMDWRKNDCNLEDSVCCPMPESRSLIPEDVGNIVFMEKKSPKSATAARKWCDYYKSACPCSKAERRDQMIAAVGGVPAKREEFPHMGAIGYGPEDDIIWQCGGSLISEDYVLTAAHCLSDGTFPAAWVRLGTVIVHDKFREKVSGSEEGQTHPVIRRIVHPDYKKPSKYNDIALLKIGHALEATASSTMSDIIHPACLQITDEIRPTVATGWGRLGPIEDPAPALQKVSLIIHDNSDCNKTYDLEIKTTAQLRRGIDDSHICAGQIEGGIDTCQGDSGGPLQSYFHEGSCLSTVVGLTSFGKVCGTKNTLGVYSRVSFFLDWIEENVWKDREICSVDNDHYGECLPLSNCSHIHQLISKGYRPVQCGYVQKEPIVCCPTPFQKIWVPPPTKIKQLSKPRLPGEAATQSCEKYKSEFKSTTVSEENLPKDKHHHPHLAFIGYGELNSIQWECGGSLISEDFVLIAAHCLSNSNCKQAKWVRLGSETFKSNVRSVTKEGTVIGQVHPIIGVTIHPEYSESSSLNDLALLKIGDPIEGNASSTLSASIHPACLQVSEKQVNKVASVGVDSLGKDDKWAGSGLEANMTAFNATCNTFLETYTEDLKEKFFICTEVDSWGGLCLYTLEGPLQILIEQDYNLYEVMGITSAKQDCVTDLPIAYTRVTSYLKWIEDHVWPSV